MKAEQPPEAELDHIRDILTGLVSYASKTRGEMHCRFDYQDKETVVLKTDVVELKVVYLAIMEASGKWAMPIRDWKPALNRFMIEFEDRLIEPI